ncbi:MAG TPA: cupredoxin domain-containing protein [Azospira sp.]|nr:cupredoxin domain-containing protein [Azospira sp.]
MRLTSIVIPALLLAVALFAAPGPAAAADLPAFQIVAKDGKLIPNRLEVPAGTKFKLQFRNEGPGPEEFESTQPRMEKVLAPGASSFVVVQPLQPGTYRIFGEFHPETAECVLVAK